MEPNPLKQLDDKPVDQDEDGGDLHGRQKEEDRDQSDDARVRELHQVGAHHAGDGAAGADGGQPRVCIEGHVDQSRGHAAQQVEQQVFRMAQDVLDVVAEDPQEPHVADQVQPAAVQEHGGHEGVQSAAGRDQPMSGDQVVQREPVERQLVEETPAR